MLVLTWKFPDFLLYFTRLFLSSWVAAEWIKSALRYKRMTQRYTTITRSVLKNVNT